MWHQCGENANRVRACRWRRSPAVARRTRSPQTLARQAPAVGVARSSSQEPRIPAHRRQAAAWRAAASGTAADAKEWRAATNRAAASGSANGWSICGSMRQELHRQRTVSQGLQTGRGDARRVARARGTVLRVLEQQGCEASTHGREKPPSPLVVPWWRKCKKAGEAKHFGDRRLRTTWQAVCHEWTPRLSRNTCCTKASLPKGAPSTSNPC